MATNIQVVSLLLLTLSSSNVVTAQSNLDLFNYHGTTTSSNGMNDYGPKDWAKVKCSDLDTCVS